MPNPIKYSTSTQSNALKKGNYWIGTNDESKGETGTTNYWNGITPAANGYTIYVDKASNGPAIFGASNDTDLLSISNIISGNNFTTATQALAWFATQSNKMVFNRDYESIVTNGLVFNYDSDFTPSYPKAGTSWYDLSNNGLGTLVNGPSYGLLGSVGVIKFDGVNDYVDCGNTLTTLVGDITLCAWVYVYNYTGFNGIVSKTVSNMAAPFDWYINSSTGIVSFLRGNGSSANGIASSGAVGLNAWKHVCVTMSGTFVTHYLNGATNGTGNRSVSTADGGTSIYIGNRNDLGVTMNGNIAAVQIYNRALTSTEITQNYNSQKTRFGL